MTEFESQGLTETRTLQLGTGYCQLRRQGFFLF